MNTRLVAPHAIAKTERTGSGLPAKSGGTVWHAGFAATAAFGVYTLFVIRGYTDVAGEFASAVLIGVILAALFSLAFALCTNGVAVAMPLQADGASVPAISGNTTSHAPRCIEDWLRSTVGCGYSSIW